MKLKILWLIFLVLNFCFAQYLSAQVHLVLSTEEKDSLLSKAIPIDSFPTDHNVFDSLIATADNFFENENYDQALAIYEEIVPYRDNSSMSFYFRGMCKCNLKKYTSAIADFTSAIGLIHSDYCNYWETGVRPMKVNEKIIGGMIDGTSLKYRYYFTFFYRGFCKMQMSDWSSAKSDFDVCLKCDMIQGTKAYTLYYRAICLYNIGDHVKACADFSKAGELGCEEAYDALKAYCK